MTISRALTTTAMLAFAGLTVVTSAWGLKAAAQVPPSLRDLAWQPHVGDLLPEDIALRDSDGSAVSLGALTRGKAAIIDLGYFHCPSLCGVGRDGLLATLTQSGLRAGADYVLVDLSINPAETASDAAAAKAVDIARYNSPGAVQSWHYVTADANASTAIAHAIGFASRWDATLQQFLHPTGIVIAAPDGRISSYLLGVAALPGELRAAVARAQAGAFARPPSSILLLCFHFDQTTGRYSFAILKTLRLAAGLTVAGIIALVFALRRVKRRHFARRSTSATVIA